MYQNQGVNGGQMNGGQMNGGQMQGGQMGGQQGYPFEGALLKCRVAGCECKHDQADGLSCLSYICVFNYLLIQWPVFRAVGWSAGYNGLDRSVALGWSVNGSLHKQQQQLKFSTITRVHDLEALFGRAPPT